jgi:hypothetical protein
VIKKEMKNVHVAFDVIGDGAMLPLDHQYIHCQMTFDDIMEGFQH